MADVDNDRDRETDEWLRLEDLHDTPTASVSGPVAGAETVSVPVEGSGAEKPSAPVLGRDGGEVR